MPAPTAREVRRQLQRFGLARDRLKFRVGRTTGLSPGDLHALEHLEEAGELTPGELGQRLGLTSGAVTALVDRLERAGWVVRRPNAADRRSIVVRLSEDAEATGARELGAYEKEIDRAIGELTAGDRRAVARFLDRVLGVALRELGDERDAGKADPPRRGAR